MDGTAIELDALGVFSILICGMSAAGTLLKLKRQFIAGRARHDAGRDGDARNC